MGFHKTGDPAWGDTPAEILAEAFEKIDQSFKDEIGREVTRADLILGCFFGINDRFPNRKMKVLPQSTETVRVTTAKFNEKHEESAYVPDQPYWRED